MAYPFNLESLLWFPLGYLFGCLSFSYFVGRCLKLELTREGFSSTATVSNLGRLAGPLPAFCAILGEVGKAWLVVTLALKITGNDPWAAGLATLGAIAGHSLPFWLNFKGGKAMSPGLGALLAIWSVEPEIGQIILAALALGLPLWWLTWRVSAFSLTAASSVLLNAASLAGEMNEVYRWLIIASATFALFVLRKNLLRLLTGREHLTPFLWWKHFPNPPWIKPDCEDGG